MIRIETLESSSFLLVTGIIGVIVGGVIVGGTLLLGDIEELLGDIEYEGENDEGDMTVRGVGIAVAALLMAGMALVVAGVFVGVILVIVAGMRVGLIVGVTGLTVGVGVIIGALVGFTEVDPLRNLLLSDLGHFISPSNLKKSYPKLSIVGIMLERNSLSDSVAVIALGAILLFCVAFIYLKYPVDEIFFITALIIVLTILKSKLLKYRIGQGYYGKSSTEAKEIARFILDHSHKIDYTDDKVSRPKPILSPEDLEEVVPEILLQPGISRV